MKKLNLKDIAERVFWTFVEAFLGVIVVADIFDKDFTSVETAASAGVIASLAVVKNVAKQRLNPPLK